MKLIFAILVMIISAVTCSPPAPRTKIDPSRISVPADKEQRLFTGDKLPGSKVLIYIPLYSSIHYGIGGKLINLTATLSMRNQSIRHQAVVLKGSYYDSDGKLTHEFADKPFYLDSPGTADLVTPEQNTTGGTGANFLVEYASDSASEVIMAESVMVGENGIKRISVTSRGFKIC